MAEMKRDPMQIFVETPPHFPMKNLFLEVQSTDTVDTLMDMIYDGVGVMKDRQTLYFRSKSLKEGHTLASYNIQDGSELELFIPVPYFTPRDKDECEEKRRKSSVYSDLWSHEDLEKLLGTEYKIKMAEIAQRRVKVEKMQILVEMSTGKTISVEVLSTDTIENVKARACRIEGMIIGNQRLVFAQRNLRNDCTLADYNIKNGSKVRMSHCSYRLLIKPCTREATLVDMTPRDATVKTKESIAISECIIPDVFSAQAKSCNSHLSVPNTALQEQNSEDRELLPSLLPNPVSKCLEEVHRDMKVSSASNTLNQIIKRRKLQHQIIKRRKLQHGTPATGNDQLSMCIVALHKFKDKFSVAERVKVSELFSDNPDICLMFLAFDNEEREYWIATKVRS